MNQKVNVLIIDDTYDKVKVFSQILNETPGCRFDVCQTAQEAMIKMRNNQYDILIIDIQIPLSSGAEVSPTGGVELLENMKLDNKIKLPTHIIGITSHKETYDQCKTFFYYSGWILIDGKDDTDLIESILKSKIRHAYPKPIKVDIAIITALFKKELEQVLELPCNWKEIEFEGDSNTYHLGAITNDAGEEKSIVATSCSRMGMSAAAATTMKLCNRFSPDLLIMTGIAAGIEHKVKLGDILVADPCWDWGSGKKTIRNDQPVILVAPHQVSLDTSFRSQFLKISAQRKFLDKIYADWSGKKPPHNLNLHIGPLATGAVVLEDPDTVKDIISYHRETIGIEMEAYGVGYAASTAYGSQPKTIIIKSVCDYADPNKNDDWQDYAAYTSAQLAYNFILMK